MNNNEAGQVKRANDKLSLNNQSGRFNCPKFFNKNLNYAG